MTVVGAVRQSSSRARRFATSRGRLRARSVYRSIRASNSATPMLRPRQLAKTRSKRCPTVSLPKPTFVQPVAATLKRPRIRLPAASSSAKHARGGSRLADPDRFGSATSFNSRHLIRMPASTATRPTTTRPAPAPCTCTVGARLNSRSRCGCGRWRFRPSTARRFRRRLGMRSSRARAR